MVKSLSTDEEVQSSISDSAVGFFSDGELFQDIVRPIAYGVMGCGKKSSKLV